MKKSELVAVLNERFHDNEEVFISGSDNFNAAPITDVGRLGGEPTIYFDVNEYFGEE